MKTYFFHAAPNSKMYGDRTPPVATCIVSGAADKKVAKEAAHNALPGLVLNAGRAYADMAAADAAEQSKARLFPEVVKRSRVNLDQQRSIARLLGI